VLAMLQPHQDEPNLLDRAYNQFLNFVSSYLEREFFGNFFIGIQDAMADTPAETIESLRDKASQLRKVENPTYHQLNEAEKLEKKAWDLEFQAEIFEEIEQLAIWKGQWLPIKGIRVEGCINLDEKKTTATLKRMREKGGSTVSEMNCRMKFSK
jgi:hypothetical protein